MESNESDMHEETALYRADEIIDPNKSMAYYLETIRILSGRSW